VAVADARLLEIWNSRTHELVRSYDLGGRGEDVLVDIEYVVVGDESYVVLAHRSGLVEVVKDPLAKNPTAPAPPLTIPAPRISRRPPPSIRDGCCSSGA
jgi:hypothetical protein